MPARIIPTHRKSNVLWPVRRGQKNWIRGTLERRYLAAVHNLLRTPRGSLVWAPEYGLLVEPYRTQPMGPGAAENFRMDIQQAFARWVPDLTLLSVDVPQELASEEITVTIVWGIPSADGASVGDVVNDRERFVLGPITQEVTV